MSLPEDRSFSELFLTLLLGIIAGVLTAALSEFVKAEYERHRAQKIILLQQTRRPISCSSVGGDIGLLPFTPTVCWQAEFRLSRRGSVGSIELINVEAFLKEGKSAFLWDQYHGSPEFYGPDVIDQTPVDQQRLRIRKWSIRQFREPQEIGFTVAMAGLEASSNVGPFLKIISSDPLSVVHTEDTLWRLTVASWVIAIIVVVTSVCYGLFRHVELKKSRLELRKSEQVIRRLQRRLGQNSGGA